MSSELVPTRTLLLADKGKYSKYRTELRKTKTEEREAATVARLFVLLWDGEVQFYSDCGHLYLVAFHAIPGAVTRALLIGGKIDSWNWVGTMYGIESAMSHKLIILKDGVLPTPLSRTNWFSQEIVSMESMLGLLKSLRIWLWCAVQTTPIPL